nr:hypothetical protein Iba_chr13dCG5510 [Ipomoea batatas]
MYPEKIIALMALKTAVDADPRGKNIWADLHSQDENDKAGEQDWSQKVEVFTLLSSPESTLNGRRVRVDNPIKHSNKSLEWRVKDFLPSVLAQLTATGKLREAVKSPRKMKIGKRVLTEEGEENKEEENARTSLESLIEGSIENSDTGDESGEEDLSGDNSVDFADEAPAQLVLAETNSRGDAGVELIP